MDMQSHQMKEGTERIEEKLTTKKKKETRKTVMNLVHINRSVTKTPHIIIPLNFT